MGDIVPLNRVYVIFSDDARLISSQNFGAGVTRLYYQGIAIKLPQGTKEKRMEVVEKIASGNCGVLNEIFQEGGETVNRFTPNLEKARTYQHKEIDGELRTLRIDIPGIRLDKLALDREWTPF